MEQVSAIELSVKTIREQLDSQLTALTTRVESQSRPGLLASDPAPGHSLGSRYDSRYSPTALETNRNVMQKVEAAVAEAKSASSGEIDAAVKAILATLDKLESRIAQACAADMEALETQVRATIDELTADRSDRNATSEFAGGAGESGRSPSTIAALQSTVELHSEVLERLHMEKAEDIAATMEKLKHLLESHSTVSTAVAEVVARQTQLEQTLEKLQPPQPPHDSATSMSSATVNSSPEELHELESRLLATLTTVGGDLSKRVTMLEGAVAADDLEEDGGVFSLCICYDNQKVPCSY